jgi:NAD(P)-dependent dehydrogenase (short-subunit alcohol dehydrogenase family)
MPDMPLTDRVVVITGASSGLGVQMAGAAARAGARVVLAARRRDRLQQAADAIDGADFVTADVADAEDRRRLIDTVVERHGRLDALVNNAGVSHTGPALRQTGSEFARVLEVNLVAPFELSCLAVAAMRADGDGGGTIVNVASVMAMRSVDPFPDAAYVASKAGLVGLTRELASQWGRHGVRVNALAPGFFASEMTAGFLDGGAPDWLVGATPLKRVGAAGELDDALVFLLGPGSGFMTGQVLVVDGGLATR